MQAFDGEALEKVPVRTIHRAVLRSGLSICW